VKIALRTSGGRGEYELAGSQGPVRAHDIYNLEMFFQLRPDLVCPGHALVRVDETQGKPRIRLIPGRTGAAHAYKVLAAAVLLPDPIRELNRTPTQPSARAGNYSVTDIAVDVVDVRTDRVLLRPTQIVMATSGGWRQGIDFATRMATVSAAWTAAATGVGSLDKLLREHQQAVEAGDHARIMRASDNTYRLLGGDEDVVPTVLVRLGIADLGTPDGDDEGTPPPTGAIPPDDAENEDISVTDAERRVIRQWRKQAARGAAAAQFSRQVKQAYDFRCAFSGLRLPRAEGISPAGVQSAHILPWAKFDLNTVRNGLCLTGLCHWAFDAGVVRLDYDLKQEHIVLSVPEQVREAAAAAGLDIHHFEKMQGPLPQENFPGDRALWPSPKYLKELNRRMFPY
jgi:hypothetical protein